MWFMMPNGCDSLSVERQEFSVEFTDDKGQRFFRAPDHFATKILGMGNFVAIKEPPKGAPEDLPKADPLRDGAISELVETGKAQAVSIQQLRADVAALSAANIALKNEVTDLKKQVSEKDTKIEELTEELEEAKLAIPETGKKK